jgi:hypothetical protein
MLSAAVVGTCFIVSIGTLMAHAVDAFLDSRIPQVSPPSTATSDSADQAGREAARKVGRNARMTTRGNRQRA